MELEDGAIFLTLKDHLQPLYSKIFNFVEVNSTFYQFPPNQTIEKWRLSVPASFTFSVRCHQDLTHKIGLKWAKQAYEIIYKMKTYCDMLRSTYLVLETPAKYVINQESLKEAKDFFSTLNLGEVRIIWEYRGPETPFSSLTPVCLEKESTISINSPMTKS